MKMKGRQGRSAPEGLGLDGLILFMLRLRAKRQGDVLASLEAEEHDG